MLIQPLKTFAQMTEILIHNAKLNINPAQYNINILEWSLELELTLLLLTYESLKAQRYRP